MEENVFSRDFPIKYLILGIALGGILIKNVFDYYQEKIAREKELYEVTIYFDDKNISLIALLDTGNSLIEPLSKLPVFIVEYETIKELIPNDLRQGFTNKVEDLLQIQKLLEDMNKKNLIRIIPFKTIGSKKDFYWGLNLIL